VDPAGNLWLSFTGVPFTYVYDPNGDRARVVQLSSAGIVHPNSLFFSPAGRLLVTPGCYEFAPARRS
jgi:sugar lactone lactonase YvrE